MNSSKIEWGLVAAFIIIPMDEIHDVGDEKVMVMVMPEVVMPVVVILMMVL